MNVVGIIPARLAATRLPDKPLLDLNGQTMIERVWRRAMMARSLEAVYVATPDHEIRQVVEGFGGTAIITADTHRSGTDRLAEAAECITADIIVNIQGDEPLIEPEYINRAVSPLIAAADIDMTSLMCRCPEAEMDNSATVKVVTALNGDALLFSRARIPFQNTTYNVPVMQHIGLYAYRRAFLSRFASLRASPLELAESLEQMRALEHGFRIRMVEVEAAPLSVDTYEDYLRVRQIIADNASGPLVENY